jgi:hypothetical protein
MSARFRFSVSGKNSYSVAAHSPSTLVGFEIGKGPNRLSDEITLVAQLIESLEMKTDKFTLVLFGPSKRRKLKFGRSEVLSTRREFYTMCRPS